MKRLKQLKHPKKIVAATGILMLVTALWVSWSTLAEPLTITHGHQKFVEYKARAILKESEGGADILIEVKGLSIDKLRGVLRVRDGSRKLTETITRSEEVDGILRLFTDAPTVTEIEVEIFPTTSISLQKGDSILTWTCTKTCKWFHLYVVQDDKGM